MRKSKPCKIIISFLLLLVILVFLAACANKLNKYSLSITTEGEGIVEPAEGMHQYDESTVVTLSTTTDTANGWYFKEWGGPDGSEIVDNKILIDQDRSIQAIFSKLEYSLNVTIDPVDAGQVYREILASIQSIEHGETVRLTAVSKNGYAFDHWEEDLSGSENPVNMGMDSNRNVTAVFTKLDYNLNISVYPENSGTVSKSIDSGNAYEYDQLVTVTANPAEGYVFDHWEGDLSANTNPVEVTMVSEKNITAVFIKKEYDLMVNITPAGAGTVDKVVLATVQSIEHGETVRLTATGNTGYVFDHWEGDFSGSDNPATITVEGDMVVTAVFETAIYGRVTGINSTEGIAGVTINFSDGNTTTTDSQGYWVQKDISGTVEVIPDGFPNYYGSFLMPVAREISWPAAEINFTFNGYKFDRVWGGFGWNRDDKFVIPSGIAIDSSAYVYVADTGNSMIKVFNSAGNFIRKFGSSGSGDGQFDYPYGVAVDDSGNVYVADRNNDRIQVFNSAGNFIRKWGSSGMGDGQFDNPSGVAVDGNNYVYVIDTYNFRIQVFNSEGDFLRSFGNYLVDSPRGIAVDDSGNIYVADTGNNQIQVFNNNGNFIRKWGSPGSGNGQFNEPYGVSVDDLGNVYVADSGNNRLQIFDSAGNFIRKWGSPGSGNGQFNSPYGIAVDDMANIYVLDSLNHRVQKFVPVE